jgi:hypothetical protein
MQDQVSFNPPRWLQPLFLTVAALGAVALGAGFVLDQQRTWANVLLVGNYLVGLSLGSLVLVALLYVCGARWSTPLRRLPEALALALPVGGVAVAAALLFCPALYGWTAHVPEGADTSPALRSLWLSRPFFLLRALVYLAVWITFAFLIVRNSRRQDATGDPALTRSNVRLSAGFLVAFGVTCWLSSYDWLMSLEADWASTVFGVYNFAGLFLSALAAVLVLAVCLRRGSPLNGFVTRDRLHDLGTLLFGFSSFWAYAWFCQYMLIWYTNHPEETGYIRRRSAGPWGALLIVDLLLNWGIPFAVLLFRGAKCRPLIVAAVALVVLAGRWADLALIIFPTQAGLPAAPGIIEVGPLLGGLAVFGLVVVRALAQAPLVPVKDPSLASGAGERETDALSELADAARAQ